MDVNSPVVISTVGKAPVPVPYAATALRSPAILDLVLKAKHSTTQAASNPNAIKQWVDRPWHHHMALFRRAEPLSAAAAGSRHVEHAQLRFVLLQYCHRAFEMWGTLLAI